MKGLIIIKIGASVIVQDDGEIDYTRLSKIVRDLVNILNRGYKIVLITGGSVISGKNLNIQAKGVPKNQKNPFFSSIGQPKLLRFFMDIFHQYNLTIAQILVSRDSFANRTQYFSIRDTLRNLISNNIIPLVNDNLVLHRDESGFCDNDHLTAYLGGMLNAYKIVFLTDVDGIYKNFNQLEKRELILEVNGEFDEIEKCITVSEPYKDGMKGKLNAIKLLYDLGIDSFIINGLHDMAVSKLLENNQTGTHFVPKENKKFSGVRKWLSTGAIPKGSIKVSRIGAEVIRKDIKRGSLLSRGILSYIGNFEKGDVVSVCDEDEILLGYGIIKYSSKELPSLIGQEDIIIIHADYFYGTNRGYFS